ncbi:MAG: hypothetical protein ABL904_03510, partial [Hyphomicrobiaceae bacterium]
MTARLQLSNSFEGARIDAGMQRRPCNTVSLQGFRDSWLRLCGGTLARTMTQSRSRPQAVSDAQRFDCQCA